MQRPDEAKRQDILDIAARLFAARPFHAVRLDDVAAAAKIGKGTVYIYFESKEDLYLTLIREGFGRMVKEVQQHAAGDGSGAWGRLETIVSGLVGFATRFPDLFRVMRSGAITPEDADLLRARAELTELIERVIRDGVRGGELHDPHPELTAQFVLSFMRGALLYPPPGLSPDLLKGHMLRVLLRGIGLEGAA